MYGSIGTYPISTLRKIFYNNWVSLSPEQNLKKLEFQINFFFPRLDSDF